jgi:hypothetical protein
LRRQLAYILCPVLAPRAHDGRGALLVGVVGAALALALGVAPAAWAATYTVSGTADGPAAACPASQCASLRAAVNAANASPGSTIQLGAGSYQLTAADGGQLSITAAMTIQGVGPGGSGGTTIDQTDGVDRVLSITAASGTVALTGLEVTGGHLAPAWGVSTVAEGGGVYSRSALELQDVLVTGNEAIGAGGPVAGDAGDWADGGGIRLPPGAGAGSVIGDSVVSGNEAIGGNGGSSVVTAGGGGGLAFGGGISYEGEGPLAVKNSTVSANIATGGDGGASGSGTPGEGGSGAGGGVWNSGELTVTGATIAANTATGGASGGAGSVGGFADGGGIADVEAHDVLVNSTVFGNAAQGGAANGGTAGGGFAGGLEASGSDAWLTLASDTIDANRASSADGNLDAFIGNPPTPYTFTVHDTIVASGIAPSVPDCEFHLATNPLTSEGNNLEDDTTGQCGFSPANHDLVGVSPQLAAALASNGGLTQTLAPAAGSPVLGAGGQCLDPTSLPPNQPLLVDQRGVPRANPCDIGAFQTQPPVPAAPVSTAPTPPVVSRCKCRPAAFLRLSGLSETAKIWREGNSVARISAKKKKKKLPLGTTFSFSLNRSASVRFTFTQPAGGRKVAKKCVAQTNKNKKKHRCTRTVTAGTLTFSARAGTNKVRFEGLISKHKKLKPGSYTLQVTATASGERSTTRTLHFTIAK